MHTMATIRTLFHTKTMKKMDDIFLILKIHQLMRLVNSSLAKENNVQLEKYSCVNLSMVF